MAAAAGAEQEAATVQARHRLAQAKATTAALTQHLADARIRLATRQHLDRLVQQRPSDRQPDAEYPRKLLERANQLRQEVDARTCTKVVATSVVNAYVRVFHFSLRISTSPHPGWRLYVGQDRPTSLDHQSPRRPCHHHSASPKVKPPPPFTFPSRLY